MIRPMQKKAIFLSESNLSFIKLKSLLGHTSEGRVIRDALDLAKIMEGFPAPTQHTPGTAA